jgi:hypothetical protein
MISIVSETERLLMTLMRRNTSIYSEFVDSNQDFMFEGFTFDYLDFERLI